MIYIYRNKITATKLKLTKVRTIYKSSAFFKQTEILASKNLRRNRKFVICKKAAAYKPCSQNPYETNIKTIQV